eukprot:TRINITY_DN3137_c0_g2_i1.p1 TRINITY_DN3137_c0_g2~~TRINITY_DN3137_c0_g2_i1.p1  ORF type:complete len:472 (+),score=115.25 TRINITY_DN3137_c0_g2_i1:794-2209(+)
MLHTLDEDTDEGIRYLIIDSFYKSEKQYVEYYLAAIYKSFSLMHILDLNRMDDHVFDFIFSVIEQIKVFHEDFLVKFTERIEGASGDERTISQLCVGDLVSSIFDIHPKYLLFEHHFDDALKIIDNFKMRNNVYKGFTDKVKEDMGFTMEELLHCSKERIEDYIGMFDGLLDVTNQYHTDHRALADAVKRSENLPTKVEDHEIPIHKPEVKDTVFAGLADLKGFNISLFPTNKYRKFLNDIEVKRCIMSGSQVVSFEVNYFYLFSDVLIITEMNGEEEVYKEMQYSDDLYLLPYNEPTYRLYSETGYDSFIQFTNTNDAARWRIRFPSKPMQSASMSSDDSAEYDQDESNEEPIRSGRLTLRSHKRNSLQSGRGSQFPPPQKVAEDNHIELPPLPNMSFETNVEPEITEEQQQQKIEEELSSLKEQYISYKKMIDELKQEKKQFKERTKRMNEIVDEMKPLVSFFVSYGTQ